MSTRLARYICLAAVCAALSLAQGFLPSPAVADRARARCTGAVLQLPGSIVFHGSAGALRAEVQTNLPPGAYRIRYLPGKKQFLVSPWGDKRAIIRVSLTGDRAVGERYEAYRTSLRHGAPLLVVAADASTGVTVAARDPETNTAQLALESLHRDATAQMWTQDVQQLAQNREQPLSAPDVKRALQQQGIVGAPKLTSKKVVYAARRKEQWDALEPWEKKLWNEFLGTHADAVDITRSPDELSADADVRFTMALTISYRYMDDGVRDAARELLTDTTFLTTTMVAITAYLALWMAPEPIFSKAAAVLSTIGLVAVAGFAASEIIYLGKAIFRLRDDTKHARTLRGIERAAQRFGKAFGATSLRLLLALALIKGGKHAPRPPEIPPSFSGGAPVFAGGPGVSAAVAVPRNAASIQVLADGTIQVIHGGIAMATMNSGPSAGGGGTGGGGSEPGKWQPVSENMSPRAKAYQEQVTGRTAGESYVVKGVRFDGYKNGKLIEAKGQGYENFMTVEGGFAAWFNKGKAALLQQAERQFAVADGRLLEWHVAEARFARALFRMFKRGKISISVIHTPPRVP